VADLDGIGFFILPHTMSKKFKSQASSSRAATGGLGGFTNTFGGFSSDSGSFTTAPSSLSYVAEPPDLTRISDANLVVAFKNLTKKDDTTKTRALEDIKETIVRLGNRSDDLEDGFLEAWV
jgi:E3 ubiquitin-protein ligase listerin